MVIDETQVELGSTNNRAIAYVNPALPWATGQSKSSSHVTLFFGATMPGENPNERPEALPPMIMFDSGAKTEDGQRLNLSSAALLPRVT